MPHDVFISYSSIDKTAAFAACATFEANGIRCWIAPRDVAAGAEWAEEIITAIEAAKIMVLIFSTNSNESRQVKREIELAVSRGLTIMPLRLEQVEPTRSMAYYMAGVHWIDALTPPLDTHFRKMVEWIRPHLQDGVAPDMPSPKTGTTPKPAAPASKSFAKSMFDVMFGATRSGEPLKSGEPLGIDVMSSMFQTGLDLQRQGRHADAIAAYRKVIDAFDGDTRPVCIEEVIRAFYNTGNSLNELRRHNEALATFDEALKRAEGREEEGVRETVARIMFNKAHAHDRMGHKVEAVVAYNWLIERYHDDVDGVGRDLCARSMLMKGIMKGAMGEEDHAILDYEMFLAFYADEPGQEVNTAEAMFNIGAAHGVKGRNAEAVTAYRTMLTRFRGATDPDISEFVAKALYNMGNRLSDLKKPAEAIKAYDEVAKTFGDDPRMPDRVAKAMINRANQYGALGKKKESNAGYQAVIDTFAGSSNTDVQQQVANARKWKT